MADSPMRSSEVVTEKAYIISVAGRFCSPQVDCHSVFAHNRLFDDDLQKINSAGTTWEVEEDHLLLLSANLWATLDKEGVRVDAFPALSLSARGEFPYVYEGTLRVAVSHPSPSLFSPLILLMLI